MTTPIHPTAEDFDWVANQLSGLCAKGFELLARRLRERAKCGVCGIASGHKISCPNRGSKVVIDVRDSRMPNQDEPAKPAGEDVPYGPEPSEAELADIQDMVLNHQYRRETMRAVSKLFDAYVERGRRVLAAEGSRDAARSDRDAACEATKEAFRERDEARAKLAEVERKADTRERTLATVRRECDEWHTMADEWQAIAEKRDAELAQLRAELDRLSKGSVAP